MTTVRRHLLATIGEIGGPVTAWQASEGLTKKQRDAAFSELNNAEAVGLVVRAGLGGTRGDTVLWALTPHGCAWLDEQEALDTPAVAAE